MSRTDERTGSFLHMGAANMIKEQHIYMVFVLNPVPPFSICHTYTPTHTHTLALSLSLSHAHSLTHSLTHSYIHTYTHSRTQNHTDTDNLLFDKPISGSVGVLSSSV